MVSGEKRNCEDESVLEGITTILLDIEGTTTSIKYVKDILFPYVRENLKSYIDSHWDDDEFKADLEVLKKQAKKDEEDKIENFCPIEEGEKEKESLIKNVLWQMDLDRKTTALKQLQGHVWREGYENGKLKGHVYEDVAQMFKKWCEEGRKVYIYSSGSVEAQKLLFKHSESGDLQGFISGYFDTEIGPKTEATSYTDIAKAVGCNACQILFITDVMKEATAADKAGLQVMIAIREGNAPLAESDLKSFPTLNTLKDVVLESSNKKKKICEEEDVRPQPEKTENMEVEVEASKEVKNGDAEKMEVEAAETKPEENKTEENGQGETEANTEETAGEATAEGDGENIEVDVEDSTGEKEVVSSSVEDKATEKTEPEVKETKEEVKEESADSTNDQPAEGESKETETKTQEEEKKSVNGHENGDHKEENGKEETPEEEEKKTGEANGKLETKEEVEAVPVKKLPAEEQADSTVEVTA